jgi:hypothetical protein
MEKTEEKDSKEHKMFFTEILKRTHHFTPEQYKAFMYDLLHAGFCRFDETKDLMRDFVRHTQLQVEGEPWFSAMTRERKQIMIEAGILEESKV